MAAAAPPPIVKNLLIKDASGNTQIIEVIQTAPGKFVTASGHSIKTATGAGGVRTIIKAGPTASTANAQTSQPQNIILTTSTSGGVTLTSVGQTTPVKATSVNIVTSNTGAQKTTPVKGKGKQMMAIPIQPQPPAGTTILKAANIKTEFGSPLPTSSPVIIQRAGQVLGTPVMQQIIQAGNQRLLLTQTPNGPQLTPLSSTSLQQTLGGQQITTFVTSGPGSPNGNGVSAGNIGSTFNLSKQSFISPILDHTGARKRVDFPSDVSYESKRRKAEKGGKGLRHFSMKVCEKVRTKGTTTYNEVADELVSEFASPAMGLTSIEQQFDQKNIRRRVYDALNVLMAMNIISKEKKEIKWLGLPTNSMQECTTLEKDRQKRIERLKTKTQQLHDLIIQQVAFKSLVERNKEQEKEVGQPAASASIHLPFLIVNTNKQTVIDCSISNDKMEYLFNFDGTFEIHDDIEVLKRMGLALGLDKGECTDEEIAKAKRVLPKALEDYIDQIGKRSEDWKAEFEDVEYDESESYFDHTAHDVTDGDGDNDNENVFEGTHHSTLGLTPNDNGDGLSMSMNMSDEDMEMHAAIESLHSQATQVIGTGSSPGNEDELGAEDEDSFGEEDEGLSE